jgi:hypothetical protein
VGTLSGVTPHAKTTPPPMRRWGRLLWDYRYKILRTLGVAAIIVVMVAPFVWFARLMVHEGPWWWAAVWIPVGAFLTIGALEKVFSRAGTHTTG